MRHMVRLRRFALPRRIFSPAQPFVNDQPVIAHRAAARRSCRLSQVGNAALIEREAVTLPLDHAFGFELAYVGPAASRCCANADALTGLVDRRRETAALATDGRLVATVSAIVFVPVTRRSRILRLLLQRERSG